MKKNMIPGFLDFRIRIWKFRLGESMSWTANNFEYFFSDIIEEEEAFQAYAEQRRYASTLGRTCSGNGNNTGAQHCRREATDGEKIRNLKGNISRLVSYY